MTIQKQEVSRADIHELIANSKDQKVCKALKQLMEENNYRQGRINQQKKTIDGVIRECGELGELVRAYRSACVIDEAELLQAFRAAKQAERAAEAERVNAEAEKVAEAERVNAEAERVNAEAAIAGPDDEKEGPDDKVTP